jgi:hypothetical protein
MKLSFRSIVSFSAAVLVSSSALVSEAAARRGLPPGLIHAVKSAGEVMRVEMPSVDLDAYRAEDARIEASGVPAPFRFAAVHESDFTPDNSGTWEDLADGSSLWRLRIVSPDALSLNLGLDRFNLPSGATLWLYDADGAIVQGPYKPNDRNADGGLWTAVVLGDEVVVEVHVPTASRDRVDLRIAKVNHGYRGFGESQASAAVKQGSCNIDVICPEGDPWRDQIRSVARIMITGSSLCSGQLLNNTADDAAPFFLTAQHCVEFASEAPTVVFFWNYESSTCGLLAGGNLSETQSGSTMVASWQIDTGSDFTLIRLDQIPDPSFNVYYSGWDATGDIPPGAVGIHHPSGDEKAISFDDDPLTKVNAYGSGSHQWRVGDWEQGTTEGGSSGSCIFNPSNGLCVGTLTGGTASCNDPNGPPAGYDIYGRMDVHWEGNGTPSGRLKDWLDPVGGGTTLVLDGRDWQAPTGSETWLIPAAASTPGVGTSNWKTQIVVTNPSSETRAAQIYFVASGEAWPGSPLGGAYSIAPGGSLFIDDPLAGLNPTTGLLYVTVDGEGMPVTTRTYNLADDGGTFGQGIPGILLNEASVANTLILPMAHSSAGRFRTNLGIVQTSAGSIAVRVSIHAQDGTVLATTSYATGSAFLQINNLFYEMGIGNSTVVGAWISVELIGGTPSYWTTYASIVDGDTDDPTYILPVAE